ncbi:MAG: AAA family ATPase [bacterium]
MKLESIKLKNFKAFRDVEIKDIPQFCVFVGANGTGKSTIFSVFGFLKDLLSSNVNTALSKHGGVRGIKEVRSRNSEGPIEIEIKFRSEDVINLETSSQPLITYTLQIDDENGKAYIALERLRYRRGSHGQPWTFLEMKKGEGFAVTNEMLLTETNVNELTTEPQRLKSNDILAIKGLAQFEKFKAVVAFGNLIENWHVSDIHIEKMRNEQNVNYAEHLSKDGENLSLVLQFLYKNHVDIYNKIIEQLKRRIPGISMVETKETEEGKILLKLKENAFEDPFLVRYVSDGTIKMLAYLVLLYDPKPYSLLCVEEPENQLYPSLLEELAEEFRHYGKEGNQVFVSTHSPDFLNAVNIEEVFLLKKENGYTKILSAKDNEQIRIYMENGDKMGYLWKQGLFKGIDP